MQSFDTDRADDTTCGAEPENEAPCDAETFCKECLEGLALKPWQNIKLHGNLLEVMKCGVRCRFCNFVWKSFGDNVIGKILRQYDTEKMPHITIGSGEVTYGASGFSEKVNLRFHLRDEKDKVLEYRSLFALGNDARGLHRAIWSQAGPVDFAARRATISAWLEECETQHPFCGHSLRTDGPLAARILEVRVEEGRTHVCLVSTRDLDLHNTPYLVLSHCWGSIDIECITTQQKLDNYLEYIDPGSLPKTFREALEITRALRFRYIWIDSLCIIQDDPADWQREAAKMASIYRGATLTISASTAHNSQEGCGIHTELAAATQFTTTRESPGKLPAIFAVHKHTPDESMRIKIEVLQRSPVQKRAWIFQEKTLSRRILHATHTQLIWQCVTHTETEDGLFHELEKSNHGSWRTLGSRIPELAHGPEQSGREVRGRWWSWVNEYMERNLTVPSDHYAAFAGVTKLYQDFTGDEPVLGMWKRSLHVHLAWSVYSSETWQSLSEVRIPSWSWMSFPHGIVRPSNIERFDELEGLAGAKAIEKKYDAEVLSYDVQWMGAPLVSVLKSGTVQLRGLLDRIILPRNRQGGMTSLDPDFLERIGKNIEARIEPFDVFYLFAYRKEGHLLTDPPQLFVIGLILERAGTVQTRWIRIGRVERWLKLISDDGSQICVPGNYETITLV